MAGLSKSQCHLVASSVLISFFHLASNLSFSFPPPPNPLVPQSSAASPVSRSTSFSSLLWEALGTAPNIHLCRLCDHEGYNWNCNTKNKHSERTIRKSYEIIDGEVKVKHVAVATGAGVAVPLIDAPLPDAAARTDNCANDWRNAMLTTFTGNFTPLKS